MILPNRNNIPPELAEEKHWLKVTGHKHAGTGWNLPENWKVLDDMPENKSSIFNLNGTRYLVIDCDKICGEPKKPYQKALDFLKKIIGGKATYAEWSQSGRGIHIVYDLAEYADEFPQMTGGGSYNILIDDEHPKAHVEFYFKASKLMWFTGDRIANSSDRVTGGEVAAAAAHAILESLKRESGGSLSETVKPGCKAVPQKELATLRSALMAIPPQSYLDWYAIGHACYNTGLSFEDFDEWSALDTERYQKTKADTTEAKWREYSKSSALYNAGTIYRYAKAAGWKPPRKKETNSLKPDCYTDLDQAAVFVREYGNKTRFNKATSFLVYDGKVWRENDLEAQRLSQQLTDRQMKEARKTIRKLQDRINVAEETGDKDQIVLLAAELKQAVEYRSFVLKRRDSGKIQACLKEAAPQCQIDVKELDANGFLLNTPEGTVDLRSGQISQHKGDDYCTKITAVAPGDDGKELFQEFLRQITCGDEELEAYLQEVAGMCAIGRVLVENLIIAYGSGGNGKSTYFNLLARVLGDYTGGLSAETLTTNTRKNKSPEYAELRGKRIVIAAELEEGQRLDTATVKKLCSTDPITAEKKYKDPFQFIPSHTTILYTNHLPKVGTNDRGTWDRLVVVPFNARLRNSSTEVKDFASYLFENAGGYVLSWIIEGARRFIEDEYKIALPECVKKAIDDYRNDNDWLQAFLDTCCEQDWTATTPSGKMYARYQAFCSESGEYTRSSAELKNALVEAGIEWRKTSNGKIYRGVRIKTSAEIRHDEIEAVKQG